MTITQKKLKEDGKWIRGVNVKIYRLLVKRDRLINVVRIRGDFINRMQNMYPLEYMNLWK